MPRQATSLVLVLLALSACRSAPFEVREVLPAPDAGGPSILCVVAHPDDEIAFAGTLYKTATFLGGTCDVCVLTNGEGGFKYASLAEPIHGLELTEESIGRTHLPAIRRRELLAGLEVLRVRRAFLLGQRDHRYTQDVGEVLGADAGVWDLAHVRTSLRRILAEGDYDFLLTLGPTPETHGHHKAATILALEAVQGLPADDRPIALCARTIGGDEPEPAERPGLVGFPITRTRVHPPLLFDRTLSFGYRNRLDYRIVANWAIAEHKSQGTMQLLVNRGGRERYFLFELNPPEAFAVAEAFFRSLAQPQFESKSYGPSAGANP